MAAPKSILIISYIFPPFPSVGGRRWLKFAKYLGRKGIDVHVLHAESPLEQDSPWSDELATLQNVTLHTIPAAYPKILFTTPTRLDQRLRYRMISLFLSFVHRGQYFDWALRWKKPMLRSAIKTIRQYAIDTVICTGPPFHALHHALALKERFPTIKLVSDFRDPWVERLRAHHVQETRVLHEKDLEREVLEKSDVVLTVSDTMTERLAEKCEPRHGFKIHTLFSGFDPEDIPPPSPRSVSAGIRLIYTGELYAGIRHLVDPFVGALTRLKENDPEVFQKLQVDFYGTGTETYDLPNIRLHAAVSRAELREPLSKATAAIVFIPDHVNFAFTSKFIENIGCELPMLLVSRYGRAAEFIQKNQLGYWINPDHAFETFHQALTNIVQEPRRSTTAFDKDMFALPHLTESLLNLISTKV